MVQSIPLLEMGEDPERTISTIVARKAGISLSAVASNTRILHDLGISGDDAQELLLEYADRYQVDVSDFPFSEYFEDEATIASLGSLLTLIGGREADRLTHKIPLTIKDLVEASESRRLEPNRAALNRLEGAEDLSSDKI